MCPVLVMAAGVRMVTRTSGNVRVVTWQHQHTPARLVTSEEDCSEEQPHPLPHLLPTRPGRFSNICHRSRLIELDN